MFHDVNLSNLVNVLQRNLKTDRPGEFIFRASGGTNFEFFSLSANHGGAFVGSMYVPICQKNSGYVTGRGKLLFQSN